jgi:hypothetical protein
MRIKLSALRRIIKEELKRSLREGEYQGDSKEAQYLLRKAESASQNEDIQKLIWTLGNAWKLHDRVGLALSNAARRNDLMLDSDDSPVYVAEDFIKELRVIIERAKSIDLLSNSSLVASAEEDISIAELTMKEILSSLKKYPVNKLTASISWNVQSPGHDAIEKLVKSIIVMPKEVSPNESPTR